MLHLSAGLTNGRTVHESIEYLVGMAAKDAEKKLKQLGLTAVTEGDGDVVYAQLPAPGQIVRTGTQVLVYIRKQEYTEGELP